MKFKTNSLISFSERRNAKYRVIFFPYAGGAGELYLPWFRFFPDTIACHYAQLPGRGNNFFTPAYDDLETLIADLTLEILECADRPIVFFGHSMGALIAFELSKKLTSVHNVIPKHLFLSGHRAPNVNSVMPILHRLNKMELYAELKNMGGIESETITLKMFEIFYPTLCSDLKLCELYKYKRSTPLSSKCTILWGDSDSYIQKEKIDLWSQESILPIDYHKFSGNHFYINNHAQKIAELMKKKLEEQDGL